jgi:hypothetical protein
LESAFPTAFDTTNDWEPSERNESSYPHIRYWHEAKYNYDAAAADPSAGKFPKKCRFLEDAHGQLIPERRLDDMRGRLLRSFEEIRHLMPSLLHSNGWLKCDEKLQATCYTDMRRLFPELNYCSNNWKARKLLSNWYSNYVKSRKKEEVSISEGDDDIEVTAVIPAKRTLANDSTKLRKKIKKEKGKGRAKPESGEDVSDFDGAPAQIIDPL